MNTYVHVIKKNIIGKTILRLKANKVIFEPEDVVYLAGMDSIIHSRWRVKSKDDKVVILIKEPESNYTTKLEENFEKKTTKLSNEQSEFLEECFFHKIKIYPYFDIKCNNDTENKILNELKKNDFDIEVYITSLYNEKNDYRSENENFIIIDSFGIINFKVLDKGVLTDNQQFQNFKNMLNSEDIVKKVLLNSYILSENGTDLKIGYRKIYIIESENKDDYYIGINKVIKDKGWNDVSIMNINLFIKYIYEKITNSCVLKEHERFAILQMLMPQYVNSKTVNVNNEKIDFVPKDSYEMDENQKSILACMDERIYFKAAAGSGKTILLLSKAYDLAVANPKKNFLIICFNNKLAEDIRRQAENSGKIISNLKISTLDKFIHEEVTQYYGKDNNETFNVRKKIFVENVKNKKYTKKFGGIFLDEMQQLDEEWIAALLECLDDNKYMILAGDYYQQIRLENEDSKCDEELIDDNEDDNFYIGKYGFKKVILDRNYRNSKDILKVINKMLVKINEYEEILQIPLDSDEKKITIGKSMRKSEDVPKYIHVIDKEKEVELIINCLSKLINEKKYTPNEILLVYPWGKSSKKIVRCVKENVRKINIEICDFSESKLSKDGIRLGTIGRAIGLDFKAVIIFGTGMLKNSRIDRKFGFCKFDELQKQEIEIKREFIKYLKNIYVASSRARDTLIVIDDIKEDNLISDFLRLVGENKDEK
ncbi:MAG: AAA family ATPase [Clostridia bacterium]|nr:AAA family ATPase [Clostridia bacterium]